MENLKRQTIPEIMHKEVLTFNKEVLTSAEVARYMGISMSYLYKLTMDNKIPHFKPFGKLCYFNRKEVEQWLQSNRIETTDEIDNKASLYCMQKGEKK